MGGAVLGEPKDVEPMIRKAARNPERARRAVLDEERRRRPAWSEVVKAAESILQRDWSEMETRHGDWGRDGVAAVATRHLGWRLSEAAAEVKGVSYAALAQGIRRFWRLASGRKEMSAFNRRLTSHFSKLRV